VVIDADSTADPGFARALSRYAPLNDIVVQGNVSVLNEQETWLTRLGGVLSRCRYQLTYPLKQSAGLNIPITGNGMCIGANLLQRDGWRAFSITEDSELYVQYTIDGVRILHARSATVYSQEAKSLGQGATQRRRWMAGRLWAIQRYGRPLLQSRRISWHQKLDTIVELGLASPVLHLFVALVAAAAALLLSPGWFGLGMALAAGLSVSGIVAGTLAVLWNHPEPGKTVLSFLRLPIYLMWRMLVLFGTLLTLRDKKWERTSRHASIDRGASPADQPPSHAPAAVAK
jgi:cellulose synthase/poly-beta-1,6-N-acetylglucosamine synthase-like glycosyltransferase